jgi:hypothetical protein
VVTTEEDSYETVSTPELTLVVKEAVDSLDSSISDETSLETTVVVDDHSLDSSAPVETSSLTTSTTVAVVDSYELPEATP